MRIFLIKRIFTLLLTLLVVTLVVFVVLEILPGDPAAVMLGINAEADTLNALQEQLGLNRPVWVRYLNWVADLTTGNLGISYTYDVPVSELILSRITVSFPLALLAMTLSTLIAIPMGIMAASHHNKPVDFFVMSFSQMGIAIPNFWFAMLLTLVFSVTFRLLPAGGFPGWDAGILPAFKSLLLPTIALALPQAAILARVTRSALLEVLNEDFIRTARAKGVNNQGTLWKHALRNALIPVVTIMGLQFSFLLGTDHFGRDILSMLIKGAQNSVIVAFVAIGIGIGFGVPLGLTAAARKGWIDELIMRFIDLTFAFPSLILAIMITAILGPGSVNSIIAIGIFNVPVFARVTRGAALSIWKREFILAARSAGKGQFRISLEHVLPNIASMLIVQTTIQFALGILAEASLSYLGLGTQPPMPSWGKMLNEAQTFMHFAPQLAIYPGIAIAFTVMGLNLFGDGLRDVLDPKIRRSR